MTNCTSLHEWVHSLPQYRFPFDDADIPENGIYFLFEKGEQAHGGKRIVRVGTHTGEGQLLSRLKQHFLVANKDRSILRKNIGRALLSRDNDPFLADWELDLTPRAARDLHKARIDAAKQEEVEEEVTRYMRDAFSFTVVRIDEKDARLKLESRCISTISLCNECKASSSWLGKASPKERIRESGLWLVNELYKEPLSADDLRVFKSSVI